MRRPQFTIRALLVAMLAAACFFGGIHFEQRRRQRKMVATFAAVPHAIQTVYLRVENVTALPDNRCKQLAEAVRRQIERTTPYKVVTVPSGADSELVCTVSAEGQIKNVDECFVGVKWVDGRGADLQTAVLFPLSG